MDPENLIPRVRLIDRALWIEAVISRYEFNLVEGSIETGVKAVLFYLSNQPAAKSAKRKFEAENE